MLFKAAWFSIARPKLYKTTAILSDQDEDEDSNDEDLQNLVENSNDNAEEEEDDTSYTRMNWILTSEFMTMETRQMKMCHPKIQIQKPINDETEKARRELNNISKGDK